MHFCACRQRSVNRCFNEDVHYIDNYYSESKLYPKFSNRNNVIITPETTIDQLAMYCLSNGIQVFHKQSIHALVAVAMAAKMGNTTLLEKLVQRIGVEILNAYDKNDVTPLNILCSETDVPGAIYDLEQLCVGASKLIELGANPNIPSYSGDTPLSRSALKIENMRLTDLLIQNQGKLLSCVFHFKTDSDKGFIDAEPIIRANIVQTHTVRTVLSLLSIARVDTESEFSIFPADIFRVITFHFWNRIAYIQ